MDFLFLILFVVVLVALRTAFVRLGDFDRRLSRLEAELPEPARVDAIPAPRPGPSVVSSPAAAQATPASVAELQAWFAPKLPAERETERPYEPPPQPVPQPQFAEAIPDPQPEFAEAIPDPQPQFAEAIAAVTRPQAQPPAAPPRTINWELFAGGRLLNVIGAIVLVIGVGSLLKYAWDENWVSAPLRIGAGVIAGIVLLVFGHISHVRAKSRWFEQGLFGAGLGTLYVSAYSAFAGYHLVDFAAAYAFMSLVTIVAFVVSVRYESLPMALIGWAGGFATPFAIGAGNESAVGLAMYIILLDIGLLGVSLVRREWFGLQPLALVTSYVTAFAWYAQHVNDVTTVVAAVSLLSLWLVFFVSGIAETLSQIASGVERLVFLRRASAIANGAIFWVYMHGVLAGDSAALTWVSLSAGAAYGLAYLVFVWRTPRALFERLAYALGATALLVAATATQVHHFDLVTVLACEAVLVAVVAFVCRRMGAGPASAREGLAVSFGLLGAGMLATLGMPDALDFAGNAWAFGFGGRDLMLVVFFASTMAVDRLLGGALARAWPGVVLRQLSLLALAAFESAHWPQYELSTCYAIDALALTIVDRTLRRFGSAYAPAPEASIVSLLFLVGGVGTFMLTPDAFALSSGTWDGHLGARDAALLVIAVCAFVLDRLMRRDAALAVFCTIFRQIALGAIVVLDVVHARGLGLATLLALESIALVAVDRILVKFGQAYAPGREPSSAAIAFGVLGWFAFLGSDNAFAHIGGRFALGFGGIDLTLLAFVGAAIAIERAYRRELEGLVCGALRQSAVLAAGLATIVHFDGFRLGEAFALEALILAIVGTRTVLRDLEVAGIVALVPGVGTILVTPAAWHAADIFRFAPFRDERFYAILIASVATIATGAVYLRNSLLPQWIGRSARIMGIALATFGFTVEIRDIFERAIANARLELGTPENLAHLARLVNGEGLGISAVWVVASIVLVAIGIRFRVKEFRIAAIGLFDLTILKAFFIDLSSLETPYRIISFIALGLILLGVSYVYQRLERSFFDRGPALAEPEVAEAV